MENNEPTVEAPTVITEVQPQHSKKKIIYIKNYITQSKKIIQTSLSILYIIKKIITEHFDKATSHRTLRFFAQYHHLTALDIKNNKNINVGVYICKSGDSFTLYKKNIKMSSKGWMINRVIAESVINKLVHLCVVSSRDHVII